MAGKSQGDRPTPLVWEATEDGTSCDLSGHFWAVIRRSVSDNHVVWSWMVVGYENQVLAAGQTGDLAAGRQLVEEWNRWVTSGDAALDQTDNPMAIADDCTTYQPSWPRWVHRRD